jgi:hypothetical protein
MWQVWWVFCMQKRLMDKKWMMQRRNESDRHETGDMNMKRRGSTKSPLFASPTHCLEETTLTGSLCSNSTEHPYFL